MRLDEMDANLRSMREERREPRETIRHPVCDSARTLDIGELQDLQQDIADLEDRLKNIEGTLANRNCS